MKKNTSEVDAELLELEIIKHYESNELKLRNAGVKAVYYSETCLGCKYYEDIGMTDADLVEPVVHGICHHRDIQVKSNCKGREELLGDDPHY